MTRPKSPVPAITGLGITSCIGSTLDEVAAALKDGRSGIVVSEERQQRGFRSALTGRLRGFDSSALGLKRKALKTMGEPARYAYYAAREAIRDAGLQAQHLEHPRCGIIFGNDSTVLPGVEAVCAAQAHGATRFIGSASIFQSMNSTVTMNLAALLGAQGANWTISAACASSAHAIGQSLLLIRSGLQDIVVTGGAQEMNWQSMASFDALQAFSTRHDSPTEAVRPFDRSRDGLVPSGGAACLVLEELEHARARGARIYGVVRGYGFSSSLGDHLSQSSPDSIVGAMEMALRDAEIAPGQVDYVNAHATSTPVGDLAESEAIAHVFGLGTPVSSTKSMTGHECWMAGASEALYTTLMANRGFVAPNLNFHEPDPSAPPINVVARATPATIDLAVSSSLGFGGTNAVLVLDYRLKD